MSTEKTSEQFMVLMQRYVCLRPKMILPEHVVQFKEKMASLKGLSSNPEDQAFLFRVLILLAQSGAPLTMSELSTELNVPMSSATRIVDSLVRGDMVKRVNDPNDRRVVRISMSKSGHDLHETIMTYSKQRIAKLLKDFSNDEQTQLLKLMNKLFDSLLNENKK